MFLKLFRMISCHTKTSKGQRIDKLSHSPETGLCRMALQTKRACFLREDEGRPPLAPLAPSLFGSSYRGRSAYLHRFDVAAFRSRASVIYVLKSLTISRKVLGLDLAEKVDLPKSCQTRAKQLPEKRWSAALPWLERKALREVGWNAAQSEVYHNAFEDINPSIYYRIIPRLLISGLKINKIAISGRISRDFPAHYSGGNVINGKTSEATAAFLLLQVNEAIIHVRNHNRGRSEMHSKNVAFSLNMPGTDAIWSMKRLSEEIHLSLSCCY